MKYLTFRTREHFVVQGIISCGLKIFAAVQAITVLAKHELQDLRKPGGQIWPAQDCSDRAAESVQIILVVNHFIGAAIYVRRPLIPP